jgi:hypothetical protein
VNELALVPNLVRPQSAAAPPSAFRARANLPDNSQEMYVKRTFNSQYLLFALKVYDGEILFRIRI